MGLLDTRGGKTYKLLYITPTKREYMVTLTAVGPFNEDPPFVATERPDGLIETCDTLYGSLAELASLHGCVIGEFVSVDDTN